MQMHLLSRLLLHVLLQSTHAAVQYAQSLC